MIHITKKDKKTIGKLVFSCIIIALSVVAIVSLHAAAVVPVVVEETSASISILPVPIPLKSVIIVDTDEKRMRGLSGMKTLPNDTGMFFVFDTSGKYGFWMKDMLFPIDIIWLDEDFKIITVAEDIFPNSYPQVFYPERAARYVLEVTSGVAERNHYVKGSKLGFLSKSHLQK